jgi:predicted ferric reductase
MATSMSHFISRGGAAALEDNAVMADLVKRINIPINSTSPPGLVAASLQDPWSKAGKYGLGWLYFCLILLLTTSAKYLYHYWGDKIRTALHKEEVINSAKAPSPDSPYELPSAISAMTDSSNRHFFPLRGPLPEQSREGHTMSSFAPINNIIAVFRWIFYRPIPVLKIWRVQFVFPSLGVTVVVLLGTAFCVLYVFLPQPLYYQSMAYGSPPMAIRAGMLSVALLPWVVALAARANFISVMTGIGHDRLNVLHRWGAYICLLLALIHAIPFWVQSIRDPNGFATFKLYFNQPYYIFGTGIAALAPLVVLCVHSLSFLRTWMYELFVTLHTPLAWLFLGMMFWHCNNYITSWSYLFATVALMVSSYILRLFYLNWTNPFRPSWLIGEESAVTILPENAVKVTVPTQKKWRPGQYAYLRMPGIAVFENHPFTIASLCSDDFPSEYDEQYRDMTLVFRPFGGFTRKVYDTALEKGPYKTYRAFIDGPYGGMHREMASFDQVIFFAGGSGITAIASQLLDLIKRMRDGKAVTTLVRVVWALKRPETMEWFKEELRICREYAPPGSVHCQFFITASKRYEAEPPPKPRPTSGFFNDKIGDKIGEKINDTLQGVASKRNSTIFPRDASQEIDRNAAVHQEKDDEISALPQAFLAPPRQPYTQGRSVSPNRNSMLAATAPTKTFDFGFPEAPTKHQQSLMRFAVLPSNRRDGWRTEYERPDIPYMLKKFSKDFGKKTCIYVCGPPSMRIDVANTVAKLQSDVWSNSAKDEIFLYAENYAI